MPFALAFWLLALPMVAWAAPSSWPRMPNPFVRARICEINLLAQPRGLPFLDEASLRRAAEASYPFVHKPVRRQLDELFRARSPSLTQSLQYQPTINRVDLVTRYSEIAGYNLPLYDAKGPVLYNPRAHCPSGEECRETVAFADVTSLNALPATYRAQRAVVPMPEELRASYSLSTVSLESIKESSYRIEVAVNQANIPELVRYFETGQDAAALQRRLALMLEASYQPEVYLPLETFLPRMPARRAHTYATPELIVGRMAPNCANTALNFFKADVKPYSCAANSREWIDALETSNYVELPEPVAEADLRFGDILHYRGLGGHVARVLFHGADGVTWVFQKPNFSDLSTFQVVPFREAFAPYFAFGESDLLNQISVYRRVR